MTVEPSVETLEERLARLEDALFAEHLILENPALYAQAGEPPRTEREILAWTTRRFGTIALAVTAAVSIAAGYVLTPFVTERVAPHHAAPVAAAVTATHRHATPRAPAHAAHRAAPHVAVAPPIARHPHVASLPVVHHAAIAHRAAIVLAPRAVPQPQPQRETSVLRAKLRAQERELARLRAIAAEEEAAARAAQARADAAVRAQPKPQPQPRAARAAETTATATTTVPASASVPVDAPAADPNAGAKPPSNPNGGWTERPPLPGPYGSIGPVPIGGTIDPCTPRGGRIGVVLNAILENTNLGSHIHF